MPITFSNPRVHAVIADYPLGGGKRGQCVFSTERKDGKGIRVGRKTTGAIKWDTYAGRIAIVDGEDGRTYILKTSVNYAGMITISRSDFKDAGADVTGKSGAFFPGDERYEELKALIEEADHTQGKV